MKFNEAVLKDLFSHEPLADAVKYVFLVDNEEIEKQIIYDGYMAIGITDEESKDTFLNVISECKFLWMKHL